MSTAHERAPLTAHAGSPSPDGPQKTLQAWLGQQLLLVPEAILLTVLLALHVIRGPSPLIALLGLGVTAYFGARMTLLTLGRQALAAADYDRADQLAHAAAALHPRWADAHALRGATLLARGEAPGAVDALAKAVALFPAQAELHATLSAALLEDGHPQEAVAAARAALALNPRTATAHLHLANAEEQLDAPPERVEALLRQGLAQPARPAEEAALRCALTALLLRQDRAAEARLALTGVERLLTGCPSPQRAGLHFYMGELLRLGGNADDARLHYSACEAADPHGPYAAAAWRAAHE